MATPACHPGGELAAEAEAAAVAASPVKVSSAFDAVPIDAPITPVGAIERMSELAKRGRLAGFRVVEPPRDDRGATVRMLVFGGVYDHELIVGLAPAGPGSRLSFRLRLLPRTPAIAAVIIALTIFPGLPLTDSMLNTYFSWYRIETWWWYLPLVLLMLPMMWRQYRAARAEAVREASATVERLARLLGASAAGAPDTMSAG